MTIGGTVGNLLINFLVIVFSGNSAWAIPDHAESKSASQRPRVADLSSITPELLMRAIWVVREKDNTLTTGPVPTDDGLAAREEIRRLLEGTQAVDWLVEKLEEPITVAVANRETGVYAPEEVPGKGALVAMALSILQRDGMAGRRIFVKDRFGDTMSVDVSSMDSGEELEQLKRTLKHGGAAVKKLPNGPQKLTNKMAEDEPAHQVLRWNPDAEVYEAKDLGLHRLWGARKEVKKIIDNPEFVSALSEASKVGLPHHPETFARDFMRRDDIRRLMHSALVKADPATVRADLGAAIGKYVGWTPANPNDLSGMNITHTRVTPYASVYPASHPEEGVIAFASSRSSGEIRQWAGLSRIYGADEVYTTGTVADSIYAIQEKFRQNGNRPVKVFFSGHGHPGGMVGCKVGPEMQQFVSAVRGMVKEIFLFSCSVGADVNQVRNRPKHILRTLAAGLPGTKINAVDRTLYWTAGRSWHLRSQGNLVQIESATQPEITVDSLVGDEPVWN